MKEVVALLLLLSMANAGLYWEDLHDHPWNKWGDTPSGQWSRPPGRFRTPPGYSFTPPGHSFTPPGHTFVPPGHTFVPPGHMNAPPGNMNSLSCQLSENVLSFQVGQQDNTVGSCNVACICRDPQTGDLIITETDGTQIVVSKQPEPSGIPGQNEVNNGGNSGSGNLDRGDISNINSNNNKYGTNVIGRSSESPSTNIPTTQSATTESSRNHGGEGLIDVRMGAN